MIRAILFDLDGTLVQSEKLKALSYAMAVQRLRGLPGPDARAIEAYREIVGSSRDVASRHVVERLGLEPDLRLIMEREGRSEPEKVLTAMRTSIYNEMVADPKVLRGNRWPHTVGLLSLAKRALCHTGLATMSYRTEVLHVLRALNLERSLDVVVTFEDVRQPKPDPEIYLLAAQRLDVPAGECLALEDSPAGVRAGVAAGMSVIALATPFTACGLEREQPVPEQWVVREPKRLLDTVRRCIDAHEGGISQEGPPGNPFLQEGVPRTPP